MRKLVVYYSLGGNTRFIAQNIAQATGADLLELKIAKETPPAGIKKYLWAVGQMRKKEKLELSAFDKQPDEYDVLFIGTPVWAFTYTPALARFFSTVKLQGKKVALFCSSGGGQGRTLENMKENLAGNEIIGQMGFIEPFRRNKERNAEKARAWAQNIVSGLT